MKALPFLLLLPFAMPAASPAASPTNKVNAGSTWDREKAFVYLEARQQEWAAWKPAQKAGGACLSCHTGLGYLMARRLIGESQPRPVERDLIEGVKTRLISHPPKAMLNDEGAEAILNLLALSLQRRSTLDAVGEADRVALSRLWQNQLAEGETKGAWTWFNHDLHPVESEHSVFYAVTLAERALAAYPAQEPQRVQAMHDFLRREAVRQPLHNRLAWAAFSASADKKSKRGVLEQLWAAQASDGGWSSNALGPWSKHDAAPPDKGSNAYATAWAALTAREAGADCGDRHLTRALAWLAKKQDPATGAWASPSMNKVFPAGSMQLKFMTDAASGFATAALLGCASR